MRTHSDQGLFFCTWDGCTHTNGFLQMSNLKLHIKHVHLCKRCRCPHLWRGADGKVFKCDHEASNPSSLIRHRSLKHGFDAGDDEKKVETPTPVGMTFRNSKYYRGSHAKSAKRPAGDDDSAKGPHPNRPAKRSKTTSTAPSAPRCAAPKKKKPTRKTSAPNHSREQPVDFSSAHTSPASRSSPAESIPSPITAADWDIDLGGTEEQPAPSTNPATGPAAVSDPATPAPVDAPLNSESQPETRTATAMNNWSFVPLVTDVAFTFTMPAVPVTLLVPPSNGTIDSRDPRAFLPTQVAVPVPVQPPPAYITARFASSSSSSSSSSSASASTPNVYGMGWQTQSYYPTPGSSRESTAPPAPRLSVFAGMPEWMPHAVPVSAPAADRDARAYNGFFTGTPL
ncbi:hypothetical protein GSI_10196 [Ganoderma sinense ZZ0214-1]|uniref:C2H2-type domain-containing protein n=1 Tax=Ganoderma sinense ZZ0214-1 TaxID=1077348 RepID=A0A2G8RZY5_9APHY|nr:hypothetical protein GSI_10196 [Ganoderma sinense ZZ0214-1]